MQILHTEKPESAEEKEELPDPIYDLPASTGGGKFSLHLPEELMNAHGFQHQMPVAFEPHLEESGTGMYEVVFRIIRIKEYDVDPEHLPDRVDEDDDGTEDDAKVEGVEKDGYTAPNVPFGRRNEMRMWLMKGNGRISFPIEFTTSLTVKTGGRSMSLFKAASEGILKANVESPERGRIDVRFSPPSFVESIPDDRLNEYDVDHEGDKEAPGVDWPVTKTPVSYMAGPNTNYNALRFELPHAFQHMAVLDLDGGEPVATRFAEKDGEPVLVYDFDVSEDEMDGMHVRTLIRSDWIKVGDEQYNQYRVLLSLRWAYGLGWDGETELDIEPEADKNRFLVAEKGVL